MQNEINAKLLAQIGTDQIEENEVVTILNGICQEMPCVAPDEQEYDRLYAVNRINKASKSLVDSFKGKVIELLKGPRGNESRTKTIGTRMFKLYYNMVYTWENLRLKKKSEEEKTEKDREIEEALATYKEKREAIQKKEAELRILKQEKKVAEEKLATLLPDSECIKYSPVLQVV